MRYLGIFLVCLASIAFEIFLVRHFAITNWSEYGYWVISMAMAGYSVSGVVLCLFGKAFERRQAALFYALPTAMLLLSALGYAALGLIPFNPLELQNEELFAGQLLNIGKYYLALFPFFFASGLYVGLSFLARQEDIPKIYMADLIGAGLGAAALLACLALVPPFLAPLLLLPPLTLAALTSLPGQKAAARLGFGALTLCACGLAAFVVVAHNNAAFSQYKPVSVAMNVEDNRLVAEVKSPRGYYMLLENYIERHDPDLSNNYELLGAGGPPPALGLYRDGERLAALPRAGAYDTGYIKASLDCLPYLLRKPERVLLAGGRGGFRLREALELGARQVDTVESDPVLHALLLSHEPSAPPKGWSVRLPLSDAHAEDVPPADMAAGEPAEDNASEAAGAPGPAKPVGKPVAKPAGKPAAKPAAQTGKTAKVPAKAPAHAPAKAPIPAAAFAAGHDAPTGHASSPRLGSPLVLAGRAQKPYSLIDISPEFLDQGQANKYVLTAEGIARLMRSLDANGLLSLPMGIGELPVYALKAATTVRAGLLLAGIQEPAQHIIVLRSAFTARILASRKPFSEADIAGARAFAAERSFDTPYFPGIDPKKVEVYNDLPPVSFENVTSDALSGEDAFTARDALMDDLVAFLRDGKTDSSAFRFFNLAPSTQDRPFFHEILRLERIPEVLSRIEVLPRQEIGYLVNVAVLAQAAAFALIVFLLPLAKRRGLGGISAKNILAGFGYFVCLGLGFLFIEIVLIERLTFFLNDPAQAFALVLSAMLIASGLGSAFSSRFVPRPRAGIRLACGITATLAAALGLLLPRLLDLALAWPDPAKAALAIAIAAPLGFFMGMPFPLALSTYRGATSPFIPWAWSVNGALSVVATPLANILAVSFGYSIVFAASLALYGLAALFAPDRAGQQQS
ncbi:MAG TPA: hypothetical protein VN419_09425 [Humidesulfovibrio sp.]|uniref:hypothetical protein n=1 Tax=Humidesulfovibrio sp. TaxID=2910988 RepID=UPI002C162AA2|nr:hypothetical protein [Humidesulfovibrio sp.]HWR04228.1 hypothetical protein [Humidesulfovibrio sp.]